MGLLAFGLVLFLGAHSIRIIAADWRERQIARLGRQAWRGLYSLVSLAGLVAVVSGFVGAGPQDALWQPPAFMPHLTAALVLLAFILIAAAYIPSNHFKAKIGHPMVAGVKLWAFAHLLSNAQPRDLLLFGGVLVWAIAEFATLRRRDRAAGAAYAPGSVKGDVMAVVIGAAFWLLFAFYLHKVLMGVSPLGL